MAGGSGDVVPVSAQQPGSGGRRGHRQQESWLPLDVIAEIAACSDPATLVRCAATCRDARRRIARDPSLLGRLRLRDTERFVLPLLRGHLTGIVDYTDDEDDHEEKIDTYMVDTTGAADATRLVKATFTRPGHTLRGVSMDSRGGLVLVRATTTTTTQNDTEQEHLVVCNLTTRRLLALPPEPAFPGDDKWGKAHVQYVLLVGGNDSKGAVGRPFQVLKVKLVLSEYRSYRRLLVHTFSSEHGAWSPLIEIPTPDLHGCEYSWKSVLHRIPMVVVDVVHWLCLTDSGSYMLTLHAGAARVNVTSFPASFPRDDRTDSFEEKYQYLVATATAGGNPIVLVADKDKVSAWEQSKHTKKWKPRPQLVIENKTMLEFKDDGLAEVVKEMRWANNKHVPELLWFGERSGAVLLRIHNICLLWLDLNSKKIVRCFSDRRIQYAEVYCPYEVDLSSWVPTFTSVVTL